MYFYCGPRPKELEKCYILEHTDEREKERGNRIEFLFLISNSVNPFEPRYVHVMRKKEIKKIRTQLHVVKDPN